MTVFNLSVRIVFAIVFALFVSALFAPPTFAQVGYDVMPLAELQKKADASDVHALNELVARFCSGEQGATKDKAKATEFAKKAIEKGSTLAKGYSYDEELGVAKDLKQAKQYFLQAAEEGNAEGQFQIGCIYLDHSGKWGELNLPEALKWIRKAADQGYAKAQNVLGICYYYRGWGVTQDKAEAVKWYRKAAEQGYMAAQNVLANCYDRGIGVTEDKAEAEKWRRRAAEGGFVRDCTACNDKGEIFGIIGRGFLGMKPEYGNKTCPVCGGTKKKNSGRRLCGKCKGDGFEGGEIRKYTETEYLGNGRSIDHERSVAGLVSTCSSCKGAGYLSD